jgi:hypothetical protein
VTTAVAGGRPSRLCRAAAAVALAALVAALLYLAVWAVHQWYAPLASVFPLGVAVLAAWYILSRRGVARAVASGVAALAVLVFVVVVVASESFIVLAVGLGLAAVSIGAASYALSPAAPVSAHERAPGACHPVLLLNLRSGGVRPNASGWSTCVGSETSSRWCCARATTCASSPRMQSHAAPTC